MKPLIEIVPQNSENGSCNYCQRGKLKKSNKMGLDYPYSNIVQITGTNVKTNFCPDCFDEVVKFAKDIDPTESPRA